MLKVLTLFFILISNFSFAQYRTAPKVTQFDTFINRQNIEWASYANEYVKFENFNLNKLLFNRFVKNEIEVSLPTASGTYSANHIDFILKDSLDEIILFPFLIHPPYDSLGKVPAGFFNNIKPLQVDTTTSTFTDVPQILYIEDGKLYSYVPWVSPSIVIVTTAQTRQFIGYSEYFSASYNYKFNYQPNEKKDNIFLGETTRKLKLDSIDNGSRLKELYGRNLWESLLPYALNNKLDIFTLDSKIKLSPEEISDSILSRINTVPELEGDGFIGNTGQYKYPENYFSLEDFREIQIVQDWYYNYTENIVFNKIKEFYLCAKKWTKNGEEKESSPILKIVFK